MLRNDLHLNARLLSDIFFSFQTGCEVRLAPDAGSPPPARARGAARRGVALRFVLFEELDSPPADSCADPFSLPTSLFSSSFLRRAGIKSSCGWEKGLAVAATIVGDPPTRGVFSPSNVLPISSVRRTHVSPHVGPRDLMNGLSTLSS